MTVIVNAEVQKIWNSLCEFYDFEQRKEIVSDIEMVIEKTALEKGISLSEEDDENRELNKKISARYIRAVYGIALYYLHKYPESTEIPIIEFTYGELFRDEAEPAGPEEQPG